VDKCFFVEISPFTEEFLRTFEDTHMVSRTARSRCSVPPLWRTRAVLPRASTPSTSTTMTLHLKDGGPAKWDAVKQQVADDILENVRR